MGREREGSERSIEFNWVRKDNARGGRTIGRISNGAMYLQEVVGCSASDMWLSSPWSRVELQE